MQHAPKKIALVSISLAVGGVERSVALLSRMLSSKGYKVHLIILNDRITYKYEGALFNLGAYKSESDNIVLRILRLRKLKNYLKDQHIDTVIDHRPKNQYYRELVYAKYVYKGLKKIDVIHTAQRAKFFKENKKLIALFNANCKTVAVSQYIENNILKVSGVINTATIYNAHTPVLSSEHSRTLPLELKDKTYLLFYGRLDNTSKDLEFLLNAFQKSQLWKQDIYLALLGNGPDTKDLKKLAYSLKCADHVLFLPFTDYPFHIVKQSKYVLLTSKFEGFPLVLIEALSLGVPVISLDIISGPNEIINHETNGLLVKERCVEDYSKAMIRLIEDENLYIRCQEAAKGSVTSFSFEAIASKWDYLLQTT